MRRGCAIAVMVVLLAGGCARSSASNAIALDGTPRVPDVYGVISAVNLERLTLAGRTYKVSPKLQCFATSSLQVVPLLGRLHHFVHAGVDGDEVVWLAGFGPVAQIQDAPPTVFYVGTSKGAFGGGRVKFRDGTVLPIEAGLTIPPAEQRVRADIDPESGRIRAYVPAAITPSS
jgi:hypothetical protein